MLAGDTAGLRFWCSTRVNATPNGRENSSVGWKWLYKTSAYLALVLCFIKIFGCSTEAKETKRVSWHILSIFSTKRCTDFKLFFLSPDCFCLETRLFKFTTARVSTFKTVKKENENSKIFTLLMDVYPQQAHVCGRPENYSRNVCHVLDPSATCLTCLRVSAHKLSSNIRSSMNCNDLIGRFLPWWGMSNYLASNVLKVVLVDLSYRPHWIWNKLLLTNMKRAALKITLTWNFCNLGKLVFSVTKEGFLNSLNCSCCKIVVGYNIPATYDDSKKAIWRSDPQHFIMEEGILPHR